ncbi:MAG: c-type cytochrome [Pseudomonas sp.]|uniref:cytochrome c n=1 Tax=Pseudomonas abieticivorans TaxID=2931382 RepID=UPI0020C06B93|nr:cytochrome c [Pseudomonas sp. PIA16]MDE1167820.1 c-type cytochrome [Pseudomonas sp.]
MTRLMNILALALLSANTALAADNAQVERGRYLATAADCVACHTAPAGKPFAGGLAMSTPLGTIYSSNITPSTTAGIGQYTQAQFARAVREGVRADGAHLYPAMPYTSYAKVTDDDIAAMYAYFMASVKPVDVAAAETRLPFPFNVRLSMAGWNLLFLDGQRFTPDPSKTAEVNRGAYLGEALAHCSTCHTPRNALMAEVGSQALAGSSLGTWYAPNITPDANSGVGAWQVDELVAYLKTGHAEGKAQAAGPMAEAIDHSLRHLSEPDLKALAVWLKQLPAVATPGVSKPPTAWGQPADYLGQIRGVALPQDHDQMTGPQLYDAYCASCHQANGAGSADKALPSLFHNSALGQANPDNMLMAILDGVERAEDQPNIHMPGFRSLLSDPQVATLGNYLRGQFGNPAGQVSSERVAQLRQGGAVSPLVALARYGMIGALVVVLVGLLLVWRRRR